MDNNHNSASKNMFKILHVDDDQDFLDLIQIILLKSVKYVEVTSVNSPEKAIKALNESLFDLVITDYQMPEMNGVELFSNIRLNKKSVPMILFTGKGNETLVLESIGMGFEFYLKKDYQFDKTIELLANHIQKLQARKKIKLKYLATDKNLQSTNALLETIMNNTPNLIVYLDCNFNFIKVNKAYAVADHLGGGKSDSNPDYFVGKNHFKLYPDKNAEKIFQEVITSHKSTFIYERPFEYPDNPGAITYWDWSLIPVFTESNKIEGLVFTLSNVTDRVKKSNEKPNKKIVKEYS